MAQLRANDFEVEHESGAEDAGVVIINTCGFIDNAKEESVNTILQFAGAKNSMLALMNDELSEIKADPISLGGLYQESAAQDLCRYHQVPESRPSYR